MTNIEFDEDEFEELCEQPYIPNENDEDFEGVIMKKFKDFML